jgi:hypothetical protein
VFFTVELGLGFFYGRAWFGVFLRYKCPVGSESISYWHRYRNFSQHYGKDQANTESLLRGPAMMMRMREKMRMPIMDSQDQHKQAFVGLCAFERENRGQSVAKKKNKRTTENREQGTVIKI